MPTLGICIPGTQHIGEEMFVPMEVPGWGVL